MKSLGKKTIERQSAASILRLILPKQLPVKQSGPEYRCVCGSEEFSCSVHEFSQRLPEAHH